MARTKRSPEDLILQRQKTIDILKKSCDRYDNGDEDESYIIVNCVRVFCHSSRMSRSLISQTADDECYFISSSTPWDGLSIPYTGLVSILMGDSEPRYIASLDDVPFVRQLSFNEWWNETVFIDASKREFSRSDLVRKFANQDGPSHVDAALDEDYFDLTRENSLGWLKGDGTGEYPMGNPIPSAIRQIGHELLKSLVLDYEKSHDHSGILIAGMMSSGTTGISVANEPKANSDFATPRSRNEPCPCGSLKRFKHCHGRFS